VLFGAGDWRTPTERRPAPPALAVGALLRFVAEHGPSDMSELTAVVTAVDPRAPRLLTLRFDRGGAALWSALYRLGRPVQYSYVQGAARAVVGADRVRRAPVGRRDAVGRAPAVVVDAARRCAARASRSPR
jgi:hypothetical protein